MHSFWLAFLAGFSGSYHCLGMCGPLQMGLLNTKSNSFFIYQLGRWFMYALLGALVGSIGIGFYNQNLIQVFSIASGALLFIGIWYPMWWHKITPKAHARLFVKISDHLLPLIKHNGELGQFAGGALHGLLPCGLLYLGLLQAALSGSTWSGFETMTAFFAGTLPALVFVKWGQRRWLDQVPATSRKWAFTFLAFLLVLRGLNLGIPFLSPHIQALQNAGGVAVECHP